MNVMYLGIFGGLFALLTLVHFIVDWFFQSHAEAMVKHNNPKVRAKHCLIYTLGFVPLLYFFDYTWVEWVIALNILFWSHFVEDTYVPVFLWAKYIRKPPEMTEPRKSETYLLIDNVNLGKTQAKYDFLPPDPKKGFVEFISTPLGKILMITVDQIIHLSFLIPLAYMAMS